MPILGVGTDIIEIGRIRDIMDRQPGFSARIFTETELAYSMPKRNRYLHLAARFAAKEAVAKALGHSFCWHDVEVANNSEGKPIVNVYGRAKQALGNGRIHISVSHTESYASAIAIVEDIA